MCSIFYFDTTNYANKTFQSCWHFYWKHVASSVLIFPVMNVAFNTYFTDTTQNPLLKNFLAFLVPQRENICLFVVYLSYVVVPINSLLYL